MKHVLKQLNETYRLTATLNPSSVNFEGDIIHEAYWDYHLEVLTTWRSQYGELKTDWNVIDTFEGVVGLSMLLAEQFLAGDFSRIGVK